MIYNNNTKFELCRYWQKLEEKGFDPSVELNKSLEISLKIALSIL